MNGGTRKRSWALACALFVLLAVPAPAGAAEAHAAAIGPAPDGQPLELVLPLAGDAAGLKRFALAVSTKGSPLYGRYEPISVLAHRFGAPPSTRRAVLRYLRGVGASNVKIDATGLFADATMRAALAERLFGVSLEQFRGARATRFIAPRGSVSLPAALRGLVTGVIGLDTRPLFTAPALSHFDRSRPLAHAAAQVSGYSPATGTQSGCAAAKATGAFTPNQYLTAYNFDPLRRANISGQGERVALIEIDGFRGSDIGRFAQCFAVHVPPIRAFGVGISRPLASGGESTLDLEVLAAAAPGLKEIDVYESQANAAAGLRAFTAPLVNPGYKPQIISASLSLCEPDIYRAIGLRGIELSDRALEIAVASGITVLASSGDSGSAACKDQRGQIVDALAVNYPASSWWVLGVGGTNLKLNRDNSISDQIVWNDADAAPGSAGGGGFDRLFHRPDYQRKVVSQDSRAVPDVGMLADLAPGYAIYCTAARPECDASKPWEAVGGTSAGTPLLAGGLALIDEDLRLHGRQDLGLANSLLYAIGSSSLRGSVFYDVTKGSNDVGPFIPGGNGQPLGCCSARPGYDEASGWGGVDLSRLLAVALAIEPKIVGVGLALPRPQSPAARHAILATVSCSGLCLMGAYAEVTIDHSKPFTVYSNVYYLSGRGKKTISLSFSRSQLAAIRSALARHKSVVATVFGAILDPAGNIERQTRGQRLVISS